MATEIEVHIETHELIIGMTVAYQTDFDDRPVHFDGSVHIHHRSQFVAAAKFVRTEWIGVRMPGTKEAAICEKFEDGSAGLLEAIGRKAFEDWNDDVLEQCQAEFAKELAHSYE